MMFTVQCVVLGGVIGLTGRAGVVHSGLQGAALESHDADVSGFSSARVQSQRSLRQVMPGLRIREINGNIQLYGRRFSGGSSPTDTVERFLDDWADSIGTPRDQVRLGAVHLGSGQVSVPVMYDAETASHRFTVVYAEQHIAGSPVFGRRATFVVRNEPGFPLVYVKSDMRELDQVEGMLRQRAGVLPLELQEQIVRAQFARTARVEATREVIWLDGHTRTARIAHEWEVAVGPADERRILTDVRTGQIVSDQQLVCFGGLPGNLAGHYMGNATEDVGTAACEDESAMPLPFAILRHGIHQTYSNSEGFYQLPGGLPGIVQAELNGLWFQVWGMSGPVPPMEVSSTNASIILQNAENTDEMVLANVNAYVQTNRARNFALNVNPALPGLSTPSMLVGANLTMPPCPGNAWYAPLTPALAFCRGFGGHPNMAWSSVILHEYAHHLIERGGSGHGTYGEGLADAFQSLVLGTPEVAVGLLGDCDVALRDPTANIRTHPCSGSPHTCGQVLSGAIWEIRELLSYSRPDDFEQVIASLTLNSVLLHSGSDIDHDIVLDFLILDDDDGDFFNGTPNQDAILAGFASRGLVLNHQVIWEDNFENDLGWTFSSIDAIHGFWERGVPVIDPDWPGSPLHDGDGSGSCLLTENDYGNTDVDSGRVRATSPVILLPPGLVSVDYLYFVNMSNDQFDDGLEVIFRLHGPSEPWQRVFHHTTNGGMNWLIEHFDWISHRSMRITKQTNFQLRLEARDLAPGSFVECAFDGMRVSWHPDPCPVDCSPPQGDGLITIADIVAVLDAFGTEGGECDVFPVHADGSYGDGVVTIGDVVAVIMSFGTCS